MVNDTENEMKTFNEMFENFQTGKITEDEWKAFCYKEYERLFDELDKEMNPE